jgi:hypothetical protein
MPGSVSGAVFVIVAVREMEANCVVDCTLQPIEMDQIIGKKR